MKNKERVFIGACCGVPFGLVGMSIGALLATIYNWLFKMQKQK